MKDVGTFGVSLGAVVAAQACHGDQRLKACFMMDAAMPADPEYSGLRQRSWRPTRDAQTMRLEWKASGGWTETDICRTLGTTRAAFAASRSGADYYVSVPGMFHVNFTDAPFWSPVMSPIGLAGPIGGQRGFSIVNAYSLAFFNLALKERRSPLLAGQSRQFPEAVMSRH